MKTITIQLTETEYEMYESLGPNKIGTHWGLLREIATWWEKQNPGKNAVDYMMGGDDGYLTEVVK